MQREILCVAIVVAVLAEHHTLRVVAIIVLLCCAGYYLTTPSDVIAPQPRRLYSQAQHLTLIRRSYTHVERPT